MTQVPAGSHQGFPLAGRTGGTVSGYMTTGPSRQHAERNDGAAVARVLLAEDDVLLREGLASLLERSGFEVVGQTGDSGWILPLVFIETLERIVKGGSVMDPALVKELVSARRRNDRDLLTGRGVVRPGGRGGRG
jgi:hypothetical protein